MHVHVCSNLCMYMYAVTYACTCICITKPRKLAITYAKRRFHKARGGPKQDMLPCPDRILQRIIHCHLRKWHVVCVCVCACAYARYVTMPRSYLTENNTLSPAWVACCVRAQVCSTSIAICTYIYIYVYIYYAYICINIYTYINIEKIWDLVKACLGNQGLKIIYIYIYMRW